MKKNELFFLTNKQILLLIFVFCAIDRVLLYNMEYVHGIVHGFAN